jgi:glycosyltransferase involved in cell wall biosynthesis
MGRYVGAAIESVLSQSVPAAEVIVVDDGSTDDSREVLASFGGSVRTIQGPGEGPAVARNLAILAASSDMIAFLDADDLWLPRKLERQLARMKSSGAGLCYTDFYKGADPAQPAEPMLQHLPEAAEGAVFEALLRCNFILTSSVLLRREVLARVGLFKPRLIGGQDVEAWLRIARHFDLACVWEPLSFYRTHGSNLTASSKYPQYHAMRWKAVLDEHADVSPWTERFIRRRWAESLYAAGRSAWRSEEFSLAQRLFFDSAAVGGSRLKAMTWMMTCSLPAKLLRGMRRARQALLASGEE